MDNLPKSISQLVLTPSLGEKVESIIPGGLESVQMNQTSAYGLLVYLGKHNSRTVKNRVRIPNRPLGALVQRENTRFFIY